MNRPTPFALACLMFAATAQAADGAIEISQVCALQTGCLPGDAPGFPVSLDQPGKYVLTSDLEHDPAIHGDVGIVNLGASEVTLDLNGFALRSTGTCEPGACDTGNVYGISGLLRSRVTVQNGSISGMNNSCVLLGEQARVKSLTVSHCSLLGISVGTNSIVAEVSVASTGRNGLTSGIGTVYQGSTFSANGLRGDIIGNFDLVSSVPVEPRATGRNICEDDLCGDGRPRYYLTEEFHTADQAPAACVSGFHMASVWEIREPSNFQYDERRGFNFPDSGSGLPSGAFGWIRTGYGSDASDSPGSGNCMAWTSTEISDKGTQLYYSTDWNDRIDWNAVTRSCNGTQLVWCVED